MSRKGFVLLLMITRTWTFITAGPKDVKCIMATTLAELELTDPNKSLLVEDGVLGSLLPLVSNGDSQMKTVTIRALKNLASLPKNGLRMIKEGAMRPLLDILFHLSPSNPGLREQAAGTIMHLAMSTMSQETEQLQVSLLESDEDIFKLFSLINLTGPDIQKSILWTFFSLCQSPSATTIKAKLRQVFFFSFFKVDFSVFPPLHSTIQEHFLFWLNKTGTAYCL